MSSEQGHTYLGLAPYLYYADATAALAWLTRVFGFTEEVRFVDSGGEVFQATLVVGGARIQLAGVGAEYWEAKGVDGPVGQLNIVYVDDANAQYERVCAALGEDVDVEPPQDQPYGARVFTVSDIGGNSWTFWQQTTDAVELPSGWREVRASDTA
ncbi:VOC family protein [Amycolatopsis sp. H20-H5]|uniref:VOC family protein n=1 Tax=Amycolatopsis sp. H20-H5 TaxID=3046309 RepID=UPI002DC022A4|nr:VOC family protein [Amycolatopsis sp. H20-H5]MEC3975962.1 VOC family protein [Amycolatopsis sp. H20-H5]